MDPVEAFPSLGAAKARLAELHGIDLERSFRDWLGQLTGRDEEGVEQLLEQAQAERAPRREPKVRERRERLEGRGSLLSPEEQRALARIAAGDTAESAAAALGKSIHTVKMQLRRSCSKLGARNATHAVALAIRSGQLVFSYPELRL